METTEKSRSAPAHSIEFVEDLQRQIDRLEKDNRAWQAEYRAARVEVERLKPTWFFIGDKLPTVNGMYIVFIPGKGRYVRRWYNGSEFTKAQFSGPNEEHITHWSDLIPAPSDPF